MDRRSSANASDNPLVIEGAVPTILLIANTSWYLYNFRRSTICALLAKGNRVVCLAPQDQYDPLLSDLGIEYIPLFMNGMSTNPFYEILSVLDIFRVLRNVQPDFVFNFTAKLNIYSGLLCKWKGIPFANNVSGLGTAFLHESVLFRGVRWLYGKVNRSAEHVFFQNEDDRAAFEKIRPLSSDAVTVLPGSGVDLNQFTYEALPDSANLTFLMIARVLGDKGVREYATASALLRKEYPDVRCLLVGPRGACNRSALSEQEIEAWAEADSVVYLGERADVRPEIAECHVLVLPSYREGMPRTVLEAAAMGRPAIVSDVPGCRQSVLAGRTGWLCAPRDVSSLYCVMRQVVGMQRDVLAEMGRNARKHMEEKFSEDLVVNAYLERVRVAVDADRR